MDLKLKEKPIKVELKSKVTSVQEKSSCGEFISYLFNCRSVAHMLHLKTNSYSEHKALDTFYNEVVDITDSIAEIMQGYKESVISGYVDFSLSKYENYKPLDYLIEVREYVRENRYKAFPNYSPVQNELDNLENLLNSTIYKIRQLK